MARRARRRRGRSRRSRIELTAHHAVEVRTNEAGHPARPRSSWWWNHHGSLARIMMLRSATPPSQAAVSWCARGGIRTRTALRPAACEAVVSANSTTRAPGFARWARHGDTTRDAACDQPRANCTRVTPRPSPNRCGAERFRAARIPTEFPVAAVDTLESIGSVERRFDEPGPDAGAARGCLARRGIRPVAPRPVPRRLAASTTSPATAPTSTSPTTRALNVRYLPAGSNTRMPRGTMIS
jgi:hypothetical protein